MDQPILALAPTRNNVSPVLERTDFEHVRGRGGQYVTVADLPRWDAPDQTIVQDRILRQAAISSVAAAKLGIELSLGSPFSWTEQRRKIKLEEVLKHRTDASPVESHIFLNGVMSGLSYKREAAPFTFKVDMSSLPAPPRPKAAVPSP
ncbi:hypothetical protein FGADI_4577 [Fusarium gaditjirri]|uniref:Uncharacterized protein n=1 Tax=Fusarium gaditjirri TaxID=282569 RepID=A0A8H4WYE5_9HYPO|nr:hypothetical protein FGADI_4577 [Fusarium gaditjirri]